jgi:hypothetical protein
VLYTERVRILIYRSVLNRYLTVGTATYPLPLTPYLDYYRPVPTNLELNCNPIYLTLLPTRARVELLPTRSYRGLGIRSRTTQPYRQ